MGSLNGFLEHMDWFQLFLLLIGAVACLFCITFHELAHGFAAYQLGDPTAKVNGRLTLNPISHIDWIGLMLLLTVRVGWAKPVPVDMRHFTPSRSRDMAHHRPGRAGGQLPPGRGWPPRGGLPDLALRCRRGRVALPDAMCFLSCMWRCSGVGHGAVQPGFRIRTAGRFQNPVGPAARPDLLHNTCAIERYVGAVLMVLAWLGVFSRAAELSAWRASS